ncbi:MAG: GNAT family N-acetyltransferase [Anaerolineales bacterium]|nr:GNAT family N-acetyltransferase [Anaerolineales bacterium]MCB9127274.1 GNAT family N-acetyltransferase [Ardenticatenales bacterium]MCB9172563.1 GNAT family N-acetyltransferase [Ardenticatenales bacterium]
MDDSALQFRAATISDLPRLVAMLTDDPLGATRECAAMPLDARYRRAFAAIDRDPNNELIVAERDGAIVAMLQLTLIPNLSRCGMWRAQIEGVRVARSARSQGVGQALLAWAMARARDAGCGLVQLTTDKARPDAHRFYERLGFVASHEGLKLTLQEGQAR